jgi:hypothetical protein
MSRYPFAIRNVWERGGDVRCWEAPLYRAARNVPTLLLNFDVFVNNATFHILNLRIISRGENLTLLFSRTALSPVRENNKVKFSGPARHSRTMINTCSMQDNIFRAYILCSITFVVQARACTILLVCGACICSCDGRFLRTNIFLRKCARRV